MTKNTLLILPLIALVIAGFAGQAFADLIGDTVTINYLFPDINTVFQTLGTGTVTAGGFTTNSFGQHDFEVFGSEITLTNVFGSDVNFLSGTFNGYQMINDTGTPPITGVTVAFSDVSGFDASRVTFDATDVWLNMHDLTTTPGLDIALDLQFGPRSVPEPSALLLLGSGFAALGAVAWRQHRRK